MFRFALYNFMGQPVSFFTVDEEAVGGSANATVKSPGHLIFIADASGSMYGDMAALRAMVEKVLTLQEYKDEDVFASLLSFSSTGDLVTHFARTRISEIMAPGSKHVDAIRNMRTRGLTCISQGLEAVPGLVQPTELTAVVLLSDGFANDRSPGAEKRQIDTIVECIRTLPNTFVHTIAFRDWADYKLLAYVANACSGTCFNAPSVKEVFNVLHDTTNTLAGQTQPVISIPLGDASWQVFVSNTARRVVGGGSDLSIRGLRDTDRGVVYRFTEVDRQTYDSLTIPVNDSAALPFAIAKLAVGEINTAKYAMLTSRQLVLYKHATALVNEQLAAMATDMEAVLFDNASTGTATGYGLTDANIPSVMDVLSVLGSFARDLEVDGDHLRQNYQHRSVRRIPGTRNEDGTVTEPWVKTVSRSGSWMRVRSFDLNRSTATVNMLTEYDINLVRADDGSVINKVAGIDLDLKGNANYTLVGDGRVNLSGIRVRIHNKALHRKLVSLGVLSGDYVPDDSYMISFTGRPLISYGTSFRTDALTVFDEIVRLRVLSGILGASIKGESSSLTADQIAELNRHYIKPSLNVSLPTTTHYADLQAALADGSVDTRVSYNIDIGSIPLGMLSLGDLYSANEFLARHYTVNDEKKPTFATFLDRPTFGRKVLSSRTVINTVDTLMKPIFDDVLNLAPNDSVRSIVATLDVDADAVYAALWGTVDRDTAVDTLVNLRRKVDGRIASLFEGNLSTLVFYIGATGLMPFNVRALTADKIREVYPALSLGKTNEDATFYVIGDAIITVKATTEYFTTVSAAA